MGFGLGVTPLTQWSSYIRDIMLAPIKTGEPISRVSREVRKFVEATAPQKKLQSPAFQEEEEEFDLSKSKLLHNLHAANHGKVDMLV